MTMNPDWLLKHFEQISEAPDAVPRLRRFILDLAVRGKLVEQNPNDEPASDLLKRIGLNRAHDSYEDKGKNQKLHLPIEADEIAPKIPANWVLARVGELLDIQYGKALPAANRSDQGSVAVYGSNGVVSYCETALAQEPAIIIGRKGSAGALNLCQGPSWTTDVAYFLIPPLFFSIHFLFVALQTLDLENLGKGVKPGLNRSEAYQLRIVVPPLPEQHWIVAKVDELMALCDELEAAQAKRERWRDRLVAATLHGLNNGNDSPEPGIHSTFEDSARFYFNHLPRLTTRPDHIPQLRQTILNIAVQGKLVKQNIEDESSNFVLSEIRNMRISVGNHSEYSEEDNSNQKFFQHLPKVIPSNWTMCALEELFRFIDYRGRTPTRTRTGVRLVTAKNVRMGYINNEPIEFVGEELYDKWMTRGFPQKGDLLFVTEGATIGYVGMLDFLFKFVLAQRTINLQPYLPGYSRFFLFFLMSSLFQTAVLTNSTGTAARGIKAAKLKKIRVLLPPLAEQNRIVAKVDELMALCDKLEIQLTEGATTRHRLLEATLQEALTQPLHEVSYEN
jgi:type I restriction enzyme S subunit